MRGSLVSAIVGRTSIEGPDRLVAFLVTCVALFSPGIASGQSNVGCGVADFTAPAVFTIPGAATSMARGDFDGDGNLDLAVAHFGSNEVSVSLGDGLGEFAPAATFALGGFPASYPSSLTVGDFDGDGNLDLAVSNVVSDNVLVLLGDGAGGFVPSPAVPVGMNPRSIAVGDFDGDGNPDLVVTTEAAGNVSVLLGDGLGGFASASNFVAGNYYPTSIAVADFNADGNLDLVAKNFSGVFVLLGDGLGGLVTGVSLVVGYGVGPVAVADFNLDGNVDLVAANATVGGVAFPIPVDTVSVLLGDGLGSFGPEVQHPVGFRPLSLVVGEFNQDGAPDFAVANDGGGVAAFLGDGTGGFPSSTSSFAYNQPRALAAGDFDQDGISDLAYAAGSGHLAILLGDGAGSFAGRGIFDVGNVPVCIDEDDFNGDGNPDLVVANQGSIVLFGVTLPGSVSLLLGDGTGGFTPGPSPQIGSPQQLEQRSALAAGDLDGDGNSDLVVASEIAGNVEVVLGDGLGGFGPATSFPVGSRPSSMALLDANLDGLPDLAVTNRWSGDVSVLLGDGLGGFAPGGSIAVGSDPAHVAVGDFDGDTFPDLAVANEASNTVSVLRGSSVGTFSLVSTLTTGMMPGSVATGDFDQDGTLDLVVANRQSGTASIYAGDGLGGFTPTTTLTAVAGPGAWPGAGPRSVAVRDFNLDGTLDLAIATGRWNPDGVVIFLGDGLGGFSSPATGFPTGQLSRFVAVGDFDLDGAPDVAVANGDSNDVTVLLNNCDALGLGMRQPGGPGSPVFVQNANLTPGHEYYNLFAFACPSGLGNCSGPYGSWLTQANIDLVTLQWHLPVGSDPFHVIAPSSYVSWGPYSLPAVTLDAVCIDVTGGTIGAASSLVRIVVR